MGEPGGGMSLRERTWYPMGSHVLFMSQQPQDSCVHGAWDSMVTSRTGQFYRSPQPRSYLTPSPFQTTRPICCSCGALVIHRASGGVIFNSLSAKRISFIWYILFMPHFSSFLTLSVNSVFQSVLLVFLALFSKP